MKRNGQLPFAAVPEASALTGVEISAFYLGAVAGRNGKTGTGLND